MELGEFSDVGAAETFYEEDLRRNQNPQAFIAESYWDYWRFTIYFFAPQSSLASTEFNVKFIVTTSLHLEEANIGEDK